MVMKTAAQRKAELEAMARGVRTFADLTAFLKEVDAGIDADRGDEPRAEVRMRKTSYSPMSFSEVHKYGCDMRTKHWPQERTCTCGGTGRVRYLIDDGASTGECALKNLLRSFRIVVWEKN
jgi:hypothetical protein